MRPTEHVVYRHGVLEIGAFRCPADHPNFRFEGQIRDHYVFVFPRTAVWVRHEGEARFQADPGVVTYYNPGQPYTREALSPEGDRCEWFAVDAEAVRDAVSPLDPGSADRPGRELRFSHGPSDAPAYLAQRELFRSFAGGCLADPLQVEETVLHLLGHVLRLAYAARLAGGPSPDDGLRGREREAVQRARLMLAARFREPLSLAEVAAAVGLSRFRLCRAFRRLTGTTLHACREQLRMRAALQELSRPSLDLTALALDLGYSSHSHFSANFRRVFGRTPSSVRARLAYRSPRVSRWPYGGRLVSRGSGTGLPTAK